MTFFSSFRMILVFTTSACSTRVRSGTNATAFAMRRLVKAVCKCHVSRRSEHPGSAQSLKSLRFSVLLELQLAARVERQCV